MIVSVKAVQSKHLFPIIKSNLLDVKCKEFQYSIYKKGFYVQGIKNLKIHLRLKKREYNTHQRPCLTTVKVKEEQRHESYFFRRRRSIEFTAIIREMRR